MTFLSAGIFKNLYAFKMASKMSADAVSDLVPQITESDKKSHPLIHFYPALAQQTTVIWPVLG